MISERKITTKVREVSANELRGACILKFADRATSAIPDFGILALGHTFWYEMKLRRAGESLKEITKVNQLTLGHQIHTTTGGRCWTLVYEEEPKRTTVWVPRALFAHLYPKMAGETAVIFGNPCELDYCDIGPHGVNLKRVMEIYGGFWVPGWEYGVAARLAQAYA